MKVVNKQEEIYTHYIGRPTIFGNPFRIGVDGTREEVITMYENYAKGRPELLKAIKELPEDAVLGCFCKPKLCHGDAIVKMWKELHEK